MFIGLRRCRPVVSLGYRRFLSARAEAVDNDQVGHASFLAEASPKSKWKPSAANGTGDLTSGELQSLHEGKGKLTPTSSHLFKLILPLGHAKAQTDHAAPPTVFLLHPSQPLSHVSRLVAASLMPATPSISFQSPSKPSHRQQFEWSDSTDIGDFIKDAARASEFTIVIQHADDKDTKKVLTVQVPTFADHTRFLRRQLDRINAQITQMQELKHQCDVEAHRGAKRVAVGGFGVLVAYWGTVARLTFWDYGWDVMEPITYLSGLSTVVCGYLWFLYRGREVSYSSLLDSSVSARREALYRSRGFDLERWVDLHTSAKGLKKEIRSIAEDYDDGGDWKDTAEDEEAKKDRRPEGIMNDPSLEDDTSNGKRT